MEKYFYEYRPHLCFVIALYAYKFAPPSQFQLFCAGSLVACGLYVMFLRNREKVMQLFKVRRS